MTPLELFRALVLFYAAGFGVTYEKPSELFPYGRGERIEVRAMAFQPQDIGMPRDTVAWTVKQADQCNEDERPGMTYVPAFCGSHWVVEVDASWLKHAEYENVKFVAAHEAAHMVFRNDRLRPGKVDKRYEHEMDGYARRACKCLLPSRDERWPFAPTAGRYIR